VEKGFGSFNGLEILFLVCIVTGLICLLFRLITQFVRGYMVSVNCMDDRGAPTSDKPRSDSDRGHACLSVAGLSAFLMLFGLVGLALYRQGGANSIATVAGAVAAGLPADYTIGKLFQGASRLQSPGLLPDLATAIGRTATANGRAEGSRKGSLSDHL